MTKKTCFTPFELEIRNLA